LRKLVIYFVLGISIAALIMAVTLIVSRINTVHIEDILAVYRDEAEYGGLTILYPLDETLFPPEIVAPAFCWKDDKSGADTWLVTIKFQDDRERMNFVTSKQQWRPKVKEWEAIKRRSFEKEAEVTVLGVSRSAPKEILSGGRISIRTSGDEVGAPLFYREVDLPFIDAVKDPSRIRWRFGTVSSHRQPPVVLEKLPVCGNCHSFCKAGKTLAMDVDYANSKGSYVITPVEEQMVLATSDIITWDDYMKEDEEKTFGLLSQVSPDGRVVVSTVKDESVFVSKPDLAFSQLFFPIKGILCIYNRQTGTFKSLPGADDPNYVQSNPSWSPDGRYIVFARSKVYRLKSVRKDQPDSELYIIPAEGGRAKKLRANTNRMNSWHSWSPNGKWLVFSSKANTIYTQLFLTHIDEQGYSTPPVLLEHFTARDRAANIPEFVNADSSAIKKIQEQFVDDVSYVRAATECLIANDYDRAVHQCKKALALNPENIGAHHNFGLALFGQGRYDEAIRYLSKAVQMKPNSAEMRSHLGTVLIAKGMLKEAMTVLSEALRLDPNHADAHYNLGVVMFQMGKLDEAVKYWLKTILLNPKDSSAHYNLALVMLRRENFAEAIEHLLEVVHYRPDHAEAQHRLGLAFVRQGNIEKAAVHLSEAVRLDPNNGDIHYNLAVALATQGKTEEAIRHLSAAVKLKPDARAHYNLGVMLSRQGKTEEAIKHWLEVVRLDPSDLNVLLRLGAGYAEIGQFSKAIVVTEKAVNLARVVGREQLAQQIQQRLELYRQSKPFSDSVKGKQ